MKKIVIAGATGFIGQQLTSSLLERGSTVVVLTRNRNADQAMGRSGVKIALWDGETGGSWREHIDGADAVINLSGQSIGSRRWTRRRKEQLRASRVNSTLALVEAMKNCQTIPRVFLNASAVGYYGNVDAGDVTEDHASGDDFLGKLCSDWETAVRAATQFGVRVVLLRSGVVLDPHGGAMQKIVLPYRFFVGGPLGSGRQWLSWIHNEDEVRAILFALESGCNVRAPSILLRQNLSRCTNSARLLGLHSTALLPSQSPLLF